MDFYLFVACLCGLHVLGFTRLWVCVDGCVLLVICACSTLFVVVDEGLIACRDAVGGDSGVLWILLESWVLFTRCNSDYLRWLFYLLLLLVGNVLRCWLVLGFIQFKLNWCSLT